MAFVKPNAALVVVGHGSTLNPDSSAPTHQHAEEIRRRGIFAEVVCTFWKEEPGMKEVFHMLDSREVYVAPNFISEGYFCQQVIPRELGLDGAVTVRDGRVIKYCDPVGIHPNMTKLLLQRADEVAGGVPRAETSLVIVGHGTSLNENSAKAIKAQVELIRAGGHGFAEVLDAYMEEAPFIADWHKNSSAPNVVVVPFFIADGLHSYQDIPVMLGIETEPGAAASEREVFRHNPRALHGRQLYFSNAIGTEKLMADVILDQVEEFDRRQESAGGGMQGNGKDGGEAEPSSSRMGTLARWMAEGRNAMGQVAIQPLPGGGFSLYHELDAGRTGELEVFRGPEAAREIARLDDGGKFRPLKTAPSLRRGWRLDLRDVGELLLALDGLYPAQVGLACDHADGTLEAIPLRETLGRQTGMYRFANTITDEQALEMVAEGCNSQTKCLRRILWDLASGQPLTGAASEKYRGQTEPGRIPLLCIDACTHVISAARKIARSKGAPEMAEEH